jgi:hypothetical protein
MAENLGYLSLLPSDFQLRLKASAQDRQLKSTADEIGKGLNMIPTNISLDGQKLTLLEAQLMEARYSGRRLLRRLYPWAYRPQQR